VKEELHGGLLLHMQYVLLIYFVSMAACIHTIDTKIICIPARQQQGRVYTHTHGKTLLGKEAPIYLDRKVSFEEGYV